MNKLGFSSMKSLDQFRPLSGSVSGTGRTIPMSSRSSSDSTSSGSFANLKLTAEKLVKEQASVKTDLEMANTKLKKSMEHIHSLEEKLQNAINENAKLQVKQKEDAKLWKGLESKFSSTKTLCDQLTETLQHLAGQVRDAEQDKKHFEDKFSASTKAFDSLHLQMNGLTLKLESSEEKVRYSEKELMELKLEKEEREKAYKDESCRTVNLIREKDALIKDLEGAITAERLCLQSLNSQLEEVQRELSLKEDMCKCLTDAKNNLEKEKSDLQLSNEDLSRHVLASCQDIKELEDLVNGLVKKLIDLDIQSATVSEQVILQNHKFETWYKLVQQEKELTANQTQLQFSRLHDQLLHVESERGALQLEIKELQCKNVDLQKSQELVMVQHAEESLLVEEKIRKMESEAETLILKKTELEKLVTDLQEKIEQLSEASRVSENKMQELLRTISTLQSENQEIQDKMQAELQGKTELTEGLQKEIMGHEEQITSLESQINKLNESLEEKDQLHQQLKESEKQLEDQRAEIQASLAAAENTIAETKKQYDLMLESKQLELSKHLKEISQRNDQAINDIRRKFELEKQDIINHEKEKAEKHVGEMKMQCEGKLAESKEESKQSLMRLQEEHAAMLSRIKQEYAKKEMDLRSDHEEELKNVQLQAEDELQEKIISMRKEHELQMKALRSQHEDEYRKLENELELQKSKEERQRALLQMQWKVMDGNPKEDQEVTSKKDYSILSTKMRDADGGKRSQFSPTRPENEEKGSQFIRVSSQTPVTNMLKKVDKENPGSMMNVPKHSRKVTRREYEVETANGRTITKRKTKSTVMFEDPTKHKRLATPKAKANKDAVKVLKGGNQPLGGSQQRPSNIGDLFSEGSLNPYADDPYAFD